MIPVRNKKVSMIKSHMVNTQLKNYLSRLPILLNFSTSYFTPSCLQISVVLYPIGELLLASMLGLVQLRVHPFEFV